MYDVRSDAVRLNGVLYYQVLRYEAFAPKPGCSRYVHGVKWPPRKISWKRSIRLSRHMPSSAPRHAIWLTIRRSSACWICLFFRSCLQFISGWSSDSCCQLISCNCEIKKLNVLICVTFVNAAFYVFSSRTSCSWLLLKCCPVTVNWHIVGITYGDMWDMHIPNFEVGVPNPHFQFQAYARWP